jgi:hypothetical protein
VGDAGLATAERVQVDSARRLRESGWLGHAGDALSHAASGTADKLVIVAYGSVQPGERLSRTIAARAGGRVKGGGLLRRVECVAHPALSREADIRSPA